MRRKIKSIQAHPWLRLSSRQWVLLVVCLLITIINLIFYTCRWSSEFYTSTKYSKYLSLTSANDNASSDSIVSQRQFDIVLSYYSEEIDFVARYIRYLRNVSTIEKLNARVIVYNKNPRVNNQILKLLLQADVVQWLPNLGREGGTYLHHIIHHYPILANHTLFSQAGVEGITSTGLTDWYADRLEKQFNSSVGYMPLVSNRLISTYDCGSHITGNFPRMVQLWTYLEQSLCPPGGQAVAFRGQFLVSNKRIYQRPLEVYRYIYDLLTANSSHWLHRDIRSLFFKSTPDNPIFGHTVERVWTILFKCFQPDLRSRCRRRECACFDRS